MTRASRRTLSTGLGIFAFGSAPTLPLSCPWGRPLTSWPFSLPIFKGLQGGTWLSAWHTAGLDGESSVLIVTVFLSLDHSAAIAFIVSATEAQRG